MYELVLWLDMPALPGSAMVPLEPLNSHHLPGRWHVQPKGRARPLDSLRVQAGVANRRLGRGRLNHVRLWVGVCAARRAPSRSRFRGPVDPIAHDSV